MHCFLAAEGSDSLLLGELRRALPGFHELERPGLVRSEFNFVASEPLPPVTFARQWLPEATAVHAESIREWANTLFDVLVQRLPDNQPWRLHIAPHFGARDPGPSGARAKFTRTRFRSGNLPEAHDAKAATAGQHRCELIAEALDEQLKKRRRHLLKHRVDDSTAPFASGESLAQLLITSPTTGFVSVAAAPIPRVQGRLISPYPKGEVPIAVDKAAPSRAFAKLVEAEIRMGHRIHSGETCVDLGAAPGSWSYVALERGARVIAVDRAPLRDDLMRYPNVEFVQGDAFAYQPRSPVDWLLCDVIAAPERSAELVLEWVKRGWCRNFIVTIKFSGEAELDSLQAFKKTLEEIRPGFQLQRLCANKNEATVFAGSRMTP